MTAVFLIVTAVFIVGTIIIVTAVMKKAIGEARRKLK